MGTGAAPHIHWSDLTREHHVATAAHITQTHPPPTLTDSLLRHLPTSSDRAKHPTLQNHTEIFGPPLGVFMNYWEAPPRLLPAAAALKAEWQAALMPYVSAWAGGIELEPTFIYGMRFYPEGARLFRR